MKNSRLLQSVSAWFIAGVILAAYPTWGGAIVVYSYEGQPFDTIWPNPEVPQNVTEITLSFSLAVPLSNNLPLSTVTPLHFTISDGVSTGSDLSGYEILSFLLSTDENSDINEWNIRVRDPSAFIGDNFRMETRNDPNAPGGDEPVADGTEYCIRFTGSCSGVAGAINLNKPGTWSVIPIPPAVWLFGTGLLGLVGIARRKKAA